MPMGLRLCVRAPNVEETEPFWPGSHHSTDRKNSSRYKNNHIPVRNLFQKLNDTNKKNVKKTHRNPNYNGGGGNKKKGTRKKIKF